MPYALVIQKWLIKFWKFYIHNICRSLIQLVQKKYIEMEYRFSLNSYWKRTQKIVSLQTRKAFFWLMQDVAEYRSSLVSKSLPV